MLVVTLASRCQEADVFWIIVKRSGAEMLYSSIAIS